MRLETPSFYMLISRILKLKIHATSEHCSRSVFEILNQMRFRVRVRVRAHARARACVRVRVRVRGITVPNLPKRPSAPNLI